MRRTSVAPCAALGVVLVNVEHVVHRVGPPPVPPKVPVHPQPVGAEPELLARHARVVGRRVVRHADVRVADARDVAGRLSQVVAEALARRLVVVYGAGCVWPGDRVGHFYVQLRGRGGGSRQAAADMPGLSARPHARHVQRGRAPQNQRNLPNAHRAAGPGFSHPVGAPSRTGGPCGPFAYTDLGSPTAQERTVVVSQRRHKLFFPQNVAVSARLSRRRRRKGRFCADERACVAFGALLAMRRASPSRTWGGGGGTETQSGLTLLRQRHVGMRTAQPERMLLRAGSP